MDQNVRPSDVQRVVSQQMYIEQRGILRVLNLYTAILQTVMYTNRECFEDDNTFHLNDQINRTRIVIDKVAKEVISPNAHSVFNDYERLIRFLSDKNRGYVEAIPRFINWSMVQSLLVAESEQQQLGYVTYTLAVAGQLPMGSYQVVVPVVTINSVDRCLNVRGSYRIFVNTEIMQFGHVAGLWYNVLAPFVTDVEKLQRRRINRFGEELDKILKAMHIPIYPSAKNRVGIDKYECTSPLASLNNVVDLYVETNTLGRSIEAIEDDEEDLTDDADIDDADLDNPGEDEGDTSSELPGDEDEDDLGDEDAGDDAGDGVLDDESDETPDEETEEPDEPKSMYDLAKDETIDDFVFKLTVANYIDSIDRDKVDASEVSSLLLWKNMFLFIMSAECTKEYLKSINHTV